MDVSCPTCQASAPWADNPWRPFCSERCRLVDLGQWLSEAYAIPVEETYAGVETAEGSYP